MKKTFFLIIIATTAFSFAQATSKKVTYDKRNIQLVGNQNEREILLYNCRIIKQRALAAAQGCNSHLIGLWITQYLQSVGTPTALQLLNELSQNNFNNV